MSVGAILTALTLPQRPLVRALTVPPHDEEVPQVAFEFASYRPTGPARGLWLARFRRGSSTVK